MDNGHRFHGCHAAHGLIRSSGWIDNLILKKPDTPFLVLIAYDHRIWRQTSIVAGAGKVYVGTLCGNGNLLRRCVCREVWRACGHDALLCLLGR